MPVPFVLLIVPELMTEAAPALALMPTPFVPVIEP